MLCCAKIKNDGCRCIKLYWHFACNLSFDHQPDYSNKTEEIVHCCSWWITASWHLGLIIHHLYISNTDTGGLISRDWFSEWLVSGCGLELSRWMIQKDAWISVLVCVPFLQSSSPTQLYYYIPVPFFICREFTASHCFRRRILVAVLQFLRSGWFLVTCSSTLLLVALAWLVPC